MTHDRRPYPHPVKGREGRTDKNGDIRPPPDWIAVLQNPVSLALMLLTGYYSVVAALHRRRSLKTRHALMGAGVLASLTTLAAVLTVRPV